MVDTSDWLGAMFENTGLTLEKANEAATVIQVIKPFRVTNIYLNRYASSDHIYISEYRRCARLVCMPTKNFN